MTSAEKILLQSEVVNERNVLVEKVHKEFYVQLKTSGNMHGFWYATNWGQIYKVRRGDNTYLKKKPELVQKFMKRGFYIVTNLNGNSGCWDNFIIKSDCEVIDYQ